MRAVGLAMLAAGAILTFAVSARVPGINLRLAGLIIIVTGLAGLIAPSGAGAWVRRRVLTRGGVVSGDVVRGDPAACEPDDAAYPAYLLQDPAVLAAEVLNGARSGSASAAGQRGPGQRGPRRSQQDDQGWQ
jgi:hypothetical protein